LSYQVYQGIAMWPDSPFCHYYASQILTNPSLFKELNPNLNHKIVYLEQTQATGTFHLLEQDIYKPLSSEVGAETLWLPVLLVGDSRQGMRRRVLEATMKKKTIG